MGIVGAVLVTAGAAPMLFGNSENLTGDITNEQEAVDPLVALLSGGNDTTTATPVATVKPTTTPVATVKPVVAKTTPAPTKKPTAQATTSDKIVKVTNTNTGTTDTEGENFHNASALVNTSNGNIQVTNGNQSASITENGITVTNGSSSASVKTTIKPPRNIQTGFDSNMMLGLLFLLASGVLFIRSRKTA